MKNRNDSFDNLTNTLESVKNISSLLSGNKSELLPLILQKNPQLAPLLSAIDLSKGGLSSLLSLSQGSKNSDLAAMLPALLSMKNSTSKSTEKVESAATMKKGEYLSPILDFASSEVLRDILLILR